MRLRNAGPQASFQPGVRSPKSGRQAVRAFSSDAPHCAGRERVDAWNETADRSHLLDPTGPEEWRHRGPALLAPEKKSRARKIGATGIRARRWREWDLLRWSGTVLQPPETTPSAYFPKRARFRKR